MIIELLKKIYQVKILYLLSTWRIFEYISFKKQIFKKQIKKKENIIIPIEWHILFFLVFSFLDNSMIKIYLMLFLTWPTLQMWIFLNDRSKWGRNAYLINIKKIFPFLMNENLYFSAYLTVNSILTII